MNIGGVNPARSPSVADDDGVPTITNIQGSTAVGIPMLFDLTNRLARRPSSSTDVDVLLSYATSGNGSIDTMVVAINNHHGGSSVDLSGVLITTDSALTVEQTVFLEPYRFVGINPGEIEQAVICGDCIAENMLRFNMPIDRNIEVTISVMVGAYYDFGYLGTLYDQLPISYTFPSR